VLRKVDKVKEEKPRLKKKRSGPKKRASLSGNGRRFGRGEKLDLNHSEKAHRRAGA